MPSEGDHDYAACRSALSTEILCRRDVHKHTLDRFRVESSSRPPHVVGTDSTVLTPSGVPCVRNGSSGQYRSIELAGARHEQADPDLTSPQSTSAMGRARLARAVTRRGQEQRREKDRSDRYHTTAGQPVHEPVQRRKDPFADRGNQSCTPSHRTAATYRPMAPSDKLNRTHSRLPRARDGRVLPHPWQRRDAGPRDGRNGAFLQDPALRLPGLRVKTLRSLPVEDLPSPVRKDELKRRAVRRVARPEGEGPDLRLQDLAIVVGVRDEPALSGNGQDVP